MHIIYSPDLKQQRRINCRQSPITAQQVRNTPFLQYLPTVFVYEQKKTKNENISQRATSKRNIFYDVDVQKKIMFLCQQKC